MPTFAAADQFRKDLKKLDTAARTRFHDVIKNAFVPDLQAGKGFRKGLRVKHVAGTSGVWEMTWAGDGRATFEYGPELRPGEPHVIWRRIGTHEIFKRP